MQAGTHHSDETKLTLRRANARKWGWNRDQVALRDMREAEAAALPPHKQPGERLCLGCSRWFKSEWCGNRLCVNCKDAT